MKLPFDQNLSFRLVGKLASLYLGSQHVRDAGLATADDKSVWSYAQANGFTIVSKDTDFNSRCLLSGHPPKVVWIRLGNCGTQEIGDLLRRRHRDVLAFEADTDASLLALS